MQLDFTGLNSIAPKTNGEAPREPAHYGGTQVKPAPIVGHTEPQRNPQGQISIADYERIVGTAKQIIENDRINHEIEKGCRLQILQDIERKANPYLLLLIAAEAIGRLSRCGDSYFLEVQQKLIETYGHDISQDPVNKSTGFIE